MSQWYAIDDEDIENDGKSEVFSFFVHDDEWGSVYAMLTFEQIDKLKEIADWTRGWEG